MKAPLAAAAILALATTMLVHGRGRERRRTTIHFVDTGMEGLEQLQVEFGPFRDALSEITGLKVEFYPAQQWGRRRRGDARQGHRFRARRALRIRDPAEQDQGRAGGRVQPRRLLLGNRRARRQRHQHHSQLKGKRIAFDEIGSTSGHLAPAVILADAGLDPVSGIEPVHTSHQIAFEALKSGDVAAWATRWVNFNTARDADAGKGSLPGDFRVIARGPDLPDDVLVAGAHVDPAIVAKVKEAFEKPEFRRAPEGRPAFVAKRRDASMPSPSF